MFGNLHSLNFHEESKITLEGFPQSSSAHDYNFVASTRIEKIQSERIRKHSENSSRTCFDTKQYYEKHFYFRSFA